MKIIRRSIIRAFALFSVILFVYLVIDYHGPRSIKLTETNAFGMSAKMANDLIVQEYDNSGNLWATRGMIVYKLNKGDNKFIRVVHIPTGLTVFWLRNFSVLRKITVRPECIEMIQGKDGSICALSAGKIWYLAPGKKRFIPTLELDNYGFGDQGIRNDGILRTNDSTIYFGEYFQNPGRKKVNIFRSVDNGSTWKIVHTFFPGEIRHIHAIQKDPFTDRLWICTGDNDKECMVAYSEDNFNTIVPIGGGSQAWRVCQLVFTRNAIYWGTDNGRDEMAGIYRMDRASLNISKLATVDGAVFFGTHLSNGMSVMTTDREGFTNEKDHFTRLWLTDQNDIVSSIKAGTWNHNEPGFRFKFAQLRLQRNQGSSDLAVSALNQKEFGDGDLIIFTQNELQNASNKQSLY